MKKELAGRRCDSDDDVIAAVKHFLEVQDSSLYKEAALSKRRRGLCCASLSEIGCVYLRP